MINCCALFPLVQIRVTLNIPDNLHIISKFRTVAIFVVSNLLLYFTSENARHYNVRVSVTASKLWASKQIHTKRDLNTMQLKAIPALFSVQYSQ